MKKGKKELKLICCPWCMKDSLEALRKQHLRVKCNQCPFEVHINNQELEDNYIDYEMD